MPEIPDLEYLTAYVRENIIGRTITDVTVRQPVVFRMIGTVTVRDVTGKEIEGSRRYGPFLQFGLNGALEIVINLMLSGKLQHQKRGERSAGYQCFSLSLDDATKLNLCDPKLMSKVYFGLNENLGKIPRYDAQGVDVMSDQFTLERFLGLAMQHRRKQARVFLRDHSALSAIGNAYADEILFEARIHPKTFITRLSDEQLKQLYDAIRSVLAWGIDKVREAAQPVHVKVRDHLKVRNRKDEPCPRCGTTIRREGVHGHDVYFCPNCQPPTRELFIDWRKIS